MTSPTTGFASELKNLGVTTFGDLALDDDHLPEGRRYKLVVTVADLTAAQLVRLPWDYRRLYGLDPDEQPVADAVRASMAIPFFYPPVKLTGVSGATSTLVDGGVLSNFPIDTFDRPDGKPPRWPTFGITVLPRLTEGIGEVMPALKPLRFFEQTALLESLLTTMLAGHDQTHLNQPWVCVPRDRGRIDRCGRARLRYRQRIAWKSSTTGVMRRRRSSCRRGTGRLISNGSAGPVDGIRCHGPRVK